MENRPAPQRLSRRSNQCCIRLGTGTHESTGGTLRIVGDPPLIIAVTLRTARTERSARRHARAVEEPGYTNPDLLTGLTRPVESIAIWVDEAPHTS